MRYIPDPGPVKQRETVVPVTIPVFHPPGSEAVNPTVVGKVDALMARPVSHGAGRGTTVSEIHERGCGRAGERNERPKAKAECRFQNKRGNDTDGKNKVRPPR